MKHDNRRNIKYEYDMTNKSLIITPMGRSWLAPANYYTSGGGHDEHAANL